MGTRWQVPAYSPQLKNTSTFTEMTSNSRPHFHFVLYMLYAMVLDSESNQRLRNFTECGLSNGHLKRKDAVSVNAESSPSCCRVSKRQRQQRRQQLPSPTGRTGSASPAGQCWPTPKRATGPLEKRSSLEETRTPWPPAAPTSVSLSLTIRTLISAIIEVQSRGKDAGESVAPKAEWRAED